MVTLIPAIIPQIAPVRLSLLLKIPIISAGKIDEAARKGELELLPGKDTNETKEIKISQILNEVRTEIGKVVKENISKDCLELKENG